VPSNTERGWRSLKLYSDTPGGFTRDYRALTPNAPTQECHTLRRIDSPILERGAGCRRPIPAKTRSRAERLRERVAERFPQARLGRWHDELVGPHPQSMYQIAFPREMLADFMPWLMLNRDGLTVLLHPETGDNYTDHSAHAAWFGAVLPLRLEVFRRK